MKLVELLDVINLNRDDDPDNAGEIIKIMDNNGNVDAKLRISSELLKAVENRDINSIEADGENSYKIWLEDEK